MVTDVKRQQPLDVADNLITKGLDSLAEAIGWETGAFAAKVNSSWSAGIFESSKTLAGQTQAADAASTVAASSITKVAGNMLAVIGGIYSVFDYFTNLDNLMSGGVVGAIGKTVAMVGSAMAGIAGVMSLLGLASGLLGPIGIVMAIVGSLVTMFSKPRVPNVWMNTYNPDESGAPLQNWSANDAYHAVGNKSAYVGAYTPFGITVVSTHEMSLSPQEMDNAFGALLKTVKSVDIALYNTINRLDAKFGETGKTMDYYNNLLRSYNGNEAGVRTRQDASQLDTGAMVNARYSWIMDQLGASGSVVGQYLNAWFDVITNKFISASQDNAMFVLGVVDSLSKNIESFMAYPLAMADLIGQSVKAVSAGGTPDSVMAEIIGVLNAYSVVLAGFADMNLTVDGERVVKFLADINAIGFGVQDAGVNLLSYALAIEKVNGVIVTSGDELMNTVEAKFRSLKNQGYDNTQITAYFGSFGLFAGLFAEAKVAFKEADLDSAAQQIHNLAQSSVDVAKNTIDLAIANENLTNMTRDAAIATLVKSGKIEEATVAESEYGASIQTVTKNLLEQMTFVQQLGYITGKTLGDMGVSAATWQVAAKNVVTVFGDLKTAMEWLDSTAKTFLTPKDYAIYNLDTVNRSISNMQASNPALAALTESGITAALKSGEAMAGFISRIAHGNGELAKETVNYVNLIAQRITAEKALADEQQKLADAQRQLAQKAAEDLATAQKTAADAASAALDKSMQRLTASINAQKTALSDKYKSDSDALKAQLDATLKANATQKQSASDLLNSLTSVAGKLRSALGSTVVASAELDRQRRLSAQAVLQSALSLAQSGGSLANVTGLDQALADIAKPSEQLFATFEDYARDQGRTSAVISALADHADSQVSVAQLTLNAIGDAATAAQQQYDSQYKLLTDTYNAETARLDGIVTAAQTQIDLLRGIDNSILSVAAAIAGVNNAITGAAQTTTAAAPTLPFKIAEGPLSNGDYQSSGKATYSAATGLITGKTGDQYTTAQARQWVADALAAGNPAQVYTTAIAQGISAASLDALMGWDAGTSDAWASANKLPSFDVGVNYVPNDMIANIHQGERILPAADNRELMMRLSEPGRNDAELVAEIQALRKTVAELKGELEQIKKNTSDTERNTRETSNVLGKVTLGGASVRTTPA